MNEEELLKKRLGELYERSIGRGIYTYSEFLSLAGQDILKKTVVPNGFTLYGGHDAPERVIAVFGDEETCGYTEDPPVSIIKIEPLNAKFADKLTHRDFLGALMSLGIKRETIGDILTDGYTGYVICLDTVAGYISENLHEIKHTSIRCSVTQELPTVLTEAPEPTETVVSSLRCDCVAADVYKLSRSECSALFEKELVYINSVLCRSPSKVLESGDIVSVRGYGRFVYDSTLFTTKKGKLRIKVIIY